ncbi:DNA polymerase [Salmonella phage ST11]|uniref:DNA polymerase n=1 Tax=Salmonella phage ST11 TaxID=2023990 RepID=A0A222YXH7_9CAUD|nr:DNA polymerase [Salmonella phage ST11]
MNKEDDIIRCRETQDEELLHEITKGRKKAKNGIYASVAHGYGVNHHNGKTIHIGTYTTEEEAHKAYCEAAIKLHGEFAKLS